MLLLLSPHGCIDSWELFARRIGEKTVEKFVCLVSTCGVYVIGLAQTFLYDEDVWIIPNIRRNTWANAECSRKERSLGRGLFGGAESRVRDRLTEQRFATL